MLGIVMIQGTALALQVLAASIALYLVRVTGRRTAWLLLAVSIALIVYRRTLAFPKLLDAGMTAVPTGEQWLESLVLLAISVLQVVGLALLAPLFHELKAAEMIYRDAHAELEQRVTERTTALTIANADLNKEISERARVEEALRDTLAREEDARRVLEEAEQRYRTLFDISPAGILILDAPTGALVDYNAAAHVMLGYTADEYAALSWSDVEAGVTPEQMRARLLQVMHEGQLEYFTCFRTKSGAPRDMHVLCQTVELGGQPMIRAILRDITELVQARAALERQTEELRRSNTELEQFAYVASHDLQEPLRKITAFGDRLRQRFSPCLEDDGRDYLERMTGAAQRMRHLIDDLLEFSRVTTRGQPFEPVSLADVARGILSDLEVRIAELSATVHVGDLPMVDADPHQMQQVLLNLVSNGLKFHRKDVPPVISLTGRMTEYGQVELTVRDNGIGFDERFSDRIFRPFQRLHGRDAYEGSGIGLAICQRIVQRHGGTIQVRSTVGEGSVFTVTLPATHPAEGEERHVHTTDYHSVC